MIENHLCKYKSITPWEAIENYDITRLSAIIFVLRNQGWNIKTDIQYKRKYKWFGPKVVWAKYTLQD